MIERLPLIRSSLDAPHPGHERPGCMPIEL
jgi:hypothetical protein